MNDNGLKFLDIGAEHERRRIAIREQLGAGPGLFWLSGYKSDMKGTKAEALASGRQKPDAAAYALTIRATGNWAAHSPTERSAAGSPMPLPCSMPIVAVHKF